MKILDGPVEPVLCAEGVIILFFVGLITYCNMSRPVKVLQGSWGDRPNLTELVALVLCNVGLFV